MIDKKERKKANKKLTANRGKENIAVKFYIPYCIDYHNLQI